MKKLLTILTTLLTLTLSAQHNLKIKIEPGEILSEILVKYKLNSSPCNLEQFCELNNIKNKEHIIAGKSYILPISVYKFNGKSIRSTIKISDFDGAKQIENYNLDLFDNKVKANNYKNGELWVPYHLSEKCTSPTQKEKIKLTTRTYPIFGENHEEITIIDHQLNNQVFYLVGGHGGPDPGAIGKYNSNSLCEDEYAYDVTLRLAKNLLAHDATVYLIVRDPDDGIRSENILACDKDELCWKEQVIPLNQKKRLKQRSDAINELYRTNKLSGKKQYLIVLHIDSQGKSKRADLFFYHHKSSKTGKKLANRLLNTINKQYEIHQKGRGYKGTVKPRNLHMVRESLPATVYIELGNIKNKLDQKRFLLESNRQALADWLSIGILENKKSQ